MKELIAAAKVLLHYEMPTTHPCVVPMTWLRLENLCHDLSNAITRAEEREKLVEAVIKAVINYRQAIEDHAVDVCQCGNIPDCLGDCGPANARKLLSALSAFDSQESKP